jgi:hypothetical protein
LGTGVAAPNGIEPNPQILLIPQALTLDGHWRKASRIHHRHHGFRRPKILPIDGISLRKIFIVAPFRMIRCCAASGSGTGMADDGASV